MEGEKSGLTGAESRLESFVAQIKDEGQGLGYGRLIVEFGVRDGEIRDAHIIGRHRKLSPKESSGSYTTE